MLHSPPHRSRFQIHLSTAIVLMFSVGALLWANTQLRLKYVGSNLCTIGYGYPEYALEIITEFFPFNPNETGAQECRKNAKRMEAFKIYGSQTVQVIPQVGAYSAPELRMFSRRLSGIVTDVFFAVVVIFAVGGLCERLINRRTPRKEL